MNNETFDKTTRYYYGLPIFFFSLTIFIICSIDDVELLLNSPKSLPFDLIKEFTLPTHTLLYILCLIYPIIVIALKKNNLNTELRQAKIYHSANFILAIVLIFSFAFLGQKILTLKNFNQIILYIISIIVTVYQFQSKTLFVGILLTILVFIISYEKFSFNLENKTINLLKPLTLEKTCLENARFKNTHISNLNFFNCYFDKAFVENTTFNNSMFKNTDLSNVTFQNNMKSYSNTFDSCSFKTMNFNNHNLLFTEIINSNFIESVNVEYLNFEAIKINNSNLLGMVNLNLDSLCIYADLSNIRNVIYPEKIKNEIISRYEKGDEDCLYLLKSSDHYDKLITKILNSTSE